MGSLLHTPFPAMFRLASKAATTAFAVRTPVFAPTFRSFATVQVSGIGSTNAVDVVTAAPTGPQRGRDWAGQCWVFAGVGSPVVVDQCRRVRGCRDVGRAPAVVLQHTHELLCIFRVTGQLRQRREPWRSPRC